MTASAEPERGQAIGPAFSIAVPGDWIILDPALVQDASLIEEIIDRRVDEQVITRRSRDAAVALVSRVAVDIEEAGVRFGAVLLTENTGGPIVATLVVASILLTRAETSRGEQETGPVNRGEDGSITDHQDGWAEGDVTDESPGETHALEVKTDEVVITSGPALRIERMLGRAVGGSLEQEVYSVEYVVPVDANGATIVITGTSTAIRRKPALDAVFAEIANSLRLRRTAK